MPDSLHAVSALGTLANAAMRTCGGASAVRLIEQPLGSVFMLRFDEADEDAINEIAAICALRVNATARAVATSSSKALRLGPGDWLVCFASDAAVPSEWRSATSARLFVIDVSDLWFVVRVQGVYAGNVLEVGCVLDLGHAQFGPGAVAVTQLARIRALVHHVEADAYDVYVERSYAMYIWAWLGDAIQEFLLAKEPT